MKASGRAPRSNLAARTAEVDYSPEFGSAARRLGGEEWRPGRRRAGERIVERRAEPEDPRSRRAAPRRAGHVRAPLRPVADGASEGEVERQHSERDAVD